jgi:hypothetical protein
VAAAAAARSVMGMTMMMSMMVAMMVAMMMMVMRGTTQCWIGGRWSGASSRCVPAVRRAVNGNARSWWDRAGV